MVGGRIFVRRRALALIVALVFGALLTGCGSEDEEAADAPNTAVEQKAPDAAAGEEVVVRLSGTEGTIFAGNYGNLDESKYAEGALGAEPEEYVVKRRPSGFDVVSASFVKPRAGDEGTLNVEILVDGEVVAEGDTSTQYGTLNITWSSEGQ